MVLRSEFETGLTSMWNQSLLGNKINVTNILLIIIYKN